MLGTTKDTEVEGEVVAMIIDPLYCCTLETTWAKTAQDSLGWIYKGLQKAWVVNSLEKSSGNHYLQSQILFKSLNGYFLPYYITSLAVSSASMNQGCLIDVWRMSGEQHQG